MSRSSIPPQPRGFLAAGLLAFLAAGNASALVHKKFDFVVGVDGDFKAMMAAAAKKASASYRFHVFFPDGDYDIGTLTGDANQMTTFKTSFVSLVGQSQAKTTLFNKSTAEGISTTATLFLDGADDLYFQDLTLLNKANYGNTATYVQTSRHVVVREQGDRIVYKNVRLLSTQDTYYTRGTRTYWEDGAIHGTTDFICGGGDVFFQRCLFYALKKSAMTAPATTTTWGYVFNECTIDGDVSGFTLGRSWGDAKAVYLNTIMKKLPVETGWGDPMNSVPKVFAEYRSKDASGKLLDLGKRRTTYTKDATTVVLNPVLSDAEAAKYTVSNVLGGTDGWKPDQLARQVAAPVVRLAGATLQWNDDPEALCWVVFRNGKYLGNTAVPSYDVSALAKGDVVVVRAANAMGGLGAASAAATIGSTTSASRGRPSVPVLEFDRTTRTIAIRGRDPTGGEFSLSRLDGSTVAGTRVETSPGATSVRILVPPGASGIHILRRRGAGASWSVPVLLHSSRS